MLAYVQFGLSGYWRLKRRSYNAENANRVISMQQQAPALARLLYDSADRAHREGRLRTSAYYICEDHFAPPMNWSPDRLNQAIIRYLEEAVQRNHIANSSWFFIELVEQPGPSNSVTHAVRLHIMYLPPEDPPSDASDT